MNARDLVRRRDPTDRHLGDDALRIASGTPASIAVMTGPGAIAFTVTPYLAYSSASVLVSPMTPAFDAT